MRWSAAGLKLTTTPIVMATMSTADLCIMKLYAHPFHKAEFTNADQTHYMRDVCKSVNSAQQLQQQHNWC